MYTHRHIHTQLVNQHRAEARFFCLCFHLTFSQVLNGRLLIIGPEVQVHTETQRHFKKESEGFVQGIEQWMCLVRHASFANTAKEWRCCPWGGMCLQTAVGRHWIQKQQETGFLLKEKTVGAPKCSPVNSSSSHVRERYPLYTDLWNIFPF